MHDRNDVAELALKCGVKVSAALYCSQAVAVGEFGEYTNIAVIFELDTLIR